MLRLMGRRPDVDDEVGIESRILVDAADSVTARIAHDARPVQHIVEAVVRVAVDPHFDAVAIEHRFEIGHEAQIERRSGKAWMNALR